MPFAAFIVFAEGHKERYVGSLFRVDELSPMIQKCKFPTNTMKAAMAFTMPLAASNCY